MKIKSYEDVEVFRDNLSTLKETSCDSNGKETEYMVNSEVQVVNFDKVKDSYIRSLKPVITPSSNDALYLGRDNNLYFIEFKNGKLDHKQKSKLYYKIYDSLLIFTDIIGENISYCRKNLSYVLVYNEEKNSKAEIAQHITRKANLPFVRFGLERFANVYFKDVLTYTKNEFENSGIIMDMKTSE